MHAYDCIEASRGWENPQIPQTGHVWIVTPFVSRAFQFIREVEVYNGEFDLVSNGIAVNEHATTESILKAIYMSP